MNRRTIRPLMVAACVAWMGAGALAQTSQSDTGQTQALSQTQERIYGSELMTEQERNEYRSRMGATKTEQEREQLRKEQHARMKERAKQRGVTLPDEPSATGQGQGQMPRQGQGSGMGAGSGSGAGAGAGGGKGR